MNKEENTKGTSRGKRMLFELMNAIMDLENYCEKLERENKHLNEQLDVALKDYDKLQENWERLYNFTSERFNATQDAIYLDVLEQMQRLEGKENENNQ